MKHWSWRDSRNSWVDAKVKLKLNHNQKPHNESESSLHREMRQRVSALLNISWSWRPAGRQPSDWAEALGSGGRGERTHPAWLHRSSDLRGPWHNHGRPEPCGYASKAPKWHTADAFQEMTPWRSLSNGMKGKCYSHYCIKSDEQFHLTVLTQLL